MAILGVVIVLIATALVLGILSGVISFQSMALFTLQELSVVHVGLDGVTISGLSDQNAMLFGGMVIFILYASGSGMIVKSRK